MKSSLTINSDPSTNDSYQLLEDKDENAPVQTTNAVESASIQETTTLVLPLPAGLTQHFSSNDVKDIYIAGMRVADNALTWFARYPTVIRSILFPNNGSMGYFINFSSENLWFAALFGIGVIGTAIYRARLKYKEKKEEMKKKAATYSQVLNALAEKENNDILVKLEEDAKELEEFNSELTRRLEKFNAALAEEINNDASAKRKYKRIEIFSTLDEEKNLDKKETIISSLKIRYTFQDKHLEDTDDSIKNAGSSFTRKAKALYASIGLSSFAYWILWIGTAVVVGAHEAVGGIAGLTDWAAFSIPFVPAAAFLATKAYNWYRHGGKKNEEQAHLTKVTEEDSASLLERSLNRVSFETQRDALLNEYKSITGNSTQLDESAPLPHTPEYKKSLGGQVLATVYESSVNEYGGAQYACWLGTDLIKSAELMLTNTASAAAFFDSNLFIAIAIIGLTLIVAAADAMKKYRETKRELKQQADSKQPTGQDTRSLLEVFEETKRELLNLQHERTEKLGELDSAQRGLPKGEEYKALKTPYQTVGILNRKLPEPPKATSWDEKIYNFFDAQMTGIFFMRLLTTVGTAIFIPGIIPLGPVTIPVIILSGLFFAGLQFYKAHKKEQEDRNNKLKASIHQMNEQIALEKLTQRNIDAKKAQCVAAISQYNNRGDYKSSAGAAASPKTAATVVKARERTVADRADSKASAQNGLPKVSSTRMHGSFRVKSASSEMTPAASPKQATVSARKKGSELPGSQPTSFTAAQLRMITSLRGDQRDTAPSAPPLAALA